ncbi:MAG: DUF4168 domain-containing protein [Oscillatoriales cyanobacterium SM2_1_8]|nr:DUF4168 domain-containing protein [Oscillatoriales cyanobacterium SM2_1_8]
MVSNKMPRSPSETLVVFLCVDMQRALPKNVWVLGVVAGLAMGPGAAIAQPNEDQLNNYARAVYEIELKRTELLTRARTYPNWERVARLAGDRNVSVCDLRPEEQPDFLRPLCGELFAFAEQERQRRGFATNRDFNEITKLQQQEPRVQRYIQQKMLELGRKR